MPFHKRLKTKGTIIGRNGVFPIQEVEFYDMVCMEGEVTINGLGKRGIAIKGGLRFSPETMDQVAAEWIKYRKNSKKGLTIPTKCDSMC